MRDRLDGITDCYLRTSDDNEYYMPVFKSWFLQAKPSRYKYTAVQYQKQEPHQQGLLAAKYYCAAATSFSD